MNSLVVVKACEDPGVLKAISIGQLIVQIIFIIVPIVLIIMMIFDSAKTIASKEADMKTLLKSMFSRIASCALLMLTPTLVQFAVSLVSDNSVTNMTACFENVKDIEHFEQKYKEELAKEQKERDKKRAEKEKEKYDLTLYEIAQDAANNDGETSQLYDENAETFKGKTYKNISDEDIKFLTRLGIREQGSGVAGVAGEISMLINLYEQDDRGYKTLAGFAYCGWWGPAEATKANTCGLDDLKNDSCLLSKRGDKMTKKHIAAVTKVVKLGERTVPSKVNEHDCWNCDSTSYPQCSNGNVGDICSIENDGKVISDMSEIMNKENYTKNKTIINNRIGSRYIFWTFLGSDDPFGYTN